MMRSNCGTAMVCLVMFFMSFLVFQINLSWFSRSRSIHLPKTSPGLHTFVSAEIEYMKPKTLNRALSPPGPLQSHTAKQIICDRSHRDYDLCKINGPNVLDPTTSTFFLVGPTPPPYTEEKIKPYPRKWDNFPMAKIKELTLASDGPPSPKCEVHHEAPALVFSAGGYTGNFFHEFSDGIIPLFITINSVYPNDEDIVLVISKARDWWISKYADLLRAFSKYPIIDLDNDTSTHCFPSATLGLVSHGFMTINPKFMPNSQSFTHFRAFLHKAYGHGQNRPSKFSSPQLRPRLVLTSRTGSSGRVILNQIELKNLAHKVGFDVILFEPKPSTPLHKSYALINSSHALIGVHGAALTHSLFLRPGSVFMQVVPLGTVWVSKICFENSARAMGLEYVEYRIGAEESSLIDKYEKDSLVIKDPVAFQGKNWSSAVMDIYLKEQNVRIDLVKFRKYLKEVYKKAKKFMDTES